MRRCGTTCSARRSPWSTPSSPPASGRPQTAAPRHPSPSCNRTRSARARIDPHPDAPALPPHDHPPRPSPLTTKESSYDHHHPHRRHPRDRVGAGRARRGERSRRRRQERRDRRPGAAHQPRRPGVVVVRRALLRRLARAAPDGHQGLARPRTAGLVRQRGVRPRGGRLAAPLGRGLPAVRARREARLAPREGRRLLPGRGLGRARRLRRHRPGQLRPALPHHVGHRPRPRRAVPGRGRGR